MRMSGVLRRDHRRVWDLLPWYVNGTLDENDLMDVELHLEDCSSCRVELTNEKRLGLAVRSSEEFAFSHERAFSRLGLDEIKVDELVEREPRLLDLLDGFGLASPLVPLARNRLA